ncbi:glycosyltransferase [bacterium]|nr:glycosyltransferase [bacterium]
MPSAATATPRSVLYLLPVPRFYSQLGGIGGCVAHAHGVMDALLAGGAALTVLSEERPGGAAEPKADWRVHPCASGGKAGRLLWSRRFVAAVRNTVTETVGETGRGPGFDYAYMRYSVQYAPFVPATRAALGRTPLVLELNSFAAQLPGAAWRLYGRLERRAFLAADLILCVSERLRDDVARLMGPDAAARCVVIPNGVEPSRFPAPAPASAAPGAGRALAYCGVLKPAYGLEDLLAVHRELEADFPDLRLHFLGEGPLRPVLEGSPDRGRDVVFHGPVAFDRVPDLLATMDVLVHTTTRANFFQSPIKLYEYMCARRPIVAARQPQTELLLGGAEPAGWLFEVGDRASLRETLAAALADPAEGEARAARGYARVTAEHTWRQRMAGLHAALADRGLLGGGRAAG